MKLFTILYAGIFTCIIIFIHYYLGIYDDSFKELTIVEYIRIGIFTLIIDILIYGTFIYNKL